MLSSLLTPALRERFPDRGLVAGESPGAVAAFPGIHPGIRGVSVFDDGHELTVVLDDLTHGHFSEYDGAVPEAERERRIVDAVVEFLEDLFADRVAVWGQSNLGGWYRTDLGESSAPAGVPEFVWSGPRGQKQG